MKDRIYNDMISAMKSKDKDTLSVIRMLKGAIQLEEINKKLTLLDDDIIGIVSKQIKMRRESIEEFKKASRDDLISKNEEEIKLLEKYLPVQLNEVEVLNIIEEAISKLDAKLPSDMGLVMREVNPLLKGKTDMGKVSLIIKEKLSNK